MSETLIPVNPAEGDTSLILAIFRILFIVFVVPPFSLIGWTTLGAIVYIVNRFRYPKCLSSARMDGKTVIVTGANKGIGLETARDLARRGATVILACRNIIRANAAKDDIIESGGRKVEVAELDVSLMSSVRKFAKSMQNRRIDILINNAGIADIPQQLTEEGLELTVATNHLGHFLLTHLLMPNLKATGGQVINLTSIGHTWVKHVKELDMENDMKFEYDRPLKTLEIYAQTKLMNVLFTTELAKKMEGTGVTSNAVHPGVVDTDIFNAMTSRVWYGFFIKLFVRSYAKDPVEGAQTTIHVAVSEEVKGVTGKYFEDCKEGPTSPLAQDQGLAKKLWELSERLVQLQPHERTI